MYHFSNHSIEQLVKRNISQEVVLWVIANASEKVIENYVTIYQNLVEENNIKYLLRVFVNENKIPPTIITAYKTSKLKKY